jgi:hypothetical protein
MLRHTSSASADAETWWQHMVADNGYVEDVFTSRESVRPQ